MDTPQLAQAPQPAQAAIRIRALTARDVRRVAALHLAAFPASALSKLGAEAVRRYYDWQMTAHPESVALAATLDSKLAGFCFAGVFRGAVSGFVRKNQLYLATRVLMKPWLALDPMFAGRLPLLGRIAARRKAGLPSPPYTVGEYFGILAIAVHPRLQGHGIGKLLMNEAESEARKRGFVRMGLTVDPANTGAVAFYERLGWEKSPPEGPWGGVMFKPLTDEL